jgi:hypothetical protein
MQMEKMDIAISLDGLIALVDLVNDLSPDIHIPITVTEREKGNRGGCLGATFLKSSVANDLD